MLPCWRNGRSGVTGVLLHMLTGLLLSTGWTRFVRQANKKLVKRVIKQANDLELWTVGVYGKRDKLRTKKERLSSCNKVFLESSIAIEKVYFFSVFLASLYSVLKSFDVAVSDKVSEIRVVKDVTGGSKVADACKFDSYCCRCLCVCDMHRNGSTLSP